MQSTASLTGATHENCSVTWYVPSASAEGCTVSTWGVFQAAAGMVRELGVTVARLAPAHAAVGAAMLRFEAGKEISVVRFHFLPKLLEHVSLHTTAPAANIPVPPIRFP